MYHLGIDLGGTNIAAGVVDDNYKIIGEGKVKTNAPRPAEQIADDMALAAKKAVEDAGLTMDDIECVGVGAPGSINPVTGFISYSNNLEFYEVKMRELLEERLHKPIYMDNDANAAAYGEMIAGAGKGTENFVAVTLGTGVGSGIIMNGKMINGANFAGGELGHTVINFDGEDCNCGRKGCWEAYSSATALIRQTKAKMLKNRDSKMWKLVGDNIDRVSGRTAFDAMRAGDKAGKETVDEYIYYLACGLTNVINIFQPDIVCVGGGISKEGETLLKPAREHIERMRFSRNIEKQTEVKAAELGNDAGIVGAAFLDRLYK